LGGDGALSGSNALSYQQQGFGWKQNNTIGSTPQINTWTADWVNSIPNISYQFQRFAGGHFPQQERLWRLSPTAGTQPQSSTVICGAGMQLYHGRMIDWLYFGDRRSRCCDD